MSSDVVPIHGNATRGPLPERLRAALVALTPERPGAVDELRPLYDGDLVFRDPIQEVHGLEAFIAMNRRLLRRMRRLSWEIHRVRGDDSEVFMEWTMRGAVALGPSIAVCGVTRALARQGLIYDHRDYWDVGELVASAMPGGPKLLRLVRAPLA